MAQESEPNIEGQTNREIQLEKLRKLVADLEFSRDRWQGLRNHFANDLVYDIDHRFRDLLSIMKEFEESVNSKVSKSDEDNSKDSKGQI